MPQNQSFGGKAGFRKSRRYIGKLARHNVPGGMPELKNRPERTGEGGTAKSSVPSRRLIAGAKSPDTGVSG